jgi:flagellar basal body rod protein FlgB
MKKILGLTFLFLVSNPIYSDVSPDHVEEMLAQMVRENVISKEEAEKAKVRMHNMTPDQWSTVNKQAAAQAARSPASVDSQNKIEDVNKVDLDGEQFKQIQNDLKKIIPNYKN